MYSICLNSQYAKPIHNKKAVEVQNWRVFTVGQPIQINIYIKQLLYS